MFAKFFGIIQKSAQCKAQANGEAKQKRKAHHASVAVVKDSILFGLLLVEVTGLEPTASASRTQRSTKLSHTSN